MRMALQGLGVRFRTCYRQKSSRNSLRDGTINGLDSKRVLSTFKENHSFKELPYFGFMFYLLWIPFESWKSGRPSEMGLLWIQGHFLTKTVLSIISGSKIYSAICIPAPHWAALRHSRTKVLRCYHGRKDCLEIAGLSKSLGVSNQFISSSIPQSLGGSAGTDIQSL